MNYRFQDDDVITIPAPTGGVVAGQFLRIGSLSGFVLDAAAEGDPVGLARRGRVLDAPKGSVAIDAGDPLFYDETAHDFTNVEQGDASPVAVAVTDAAQEAATVDLVLVPSADTGSGYEPDGTTVDLVADHLHVKAGGHTHAQSEVTNLPGDLSGMQSAIAGKENAGAAAAAVGGHESSYAHANLPSSDQKAALAGTNGTPSGTNKYVTDSDPRLSGGGGGGEPESVAVAVAMGETTGSSAADPTHVGWAAISWLPAGADVGLANEDFTNDAVADHATGDRLASWENATALPDPDYPPTAGDDAARQTEVRRVLGQGHIPTPAFYESLATVWGLVSRCAEYAGWPYHAWLFGPPAHIRVFRCGMKCGAPLRAASETWEHVERLCRRYKPAHIRLHFADEVQ